MQQVTLPPRTKGVPHLHIGSESAMYVLSGRAITYYGPELEKYTITGPGEFLYIAPGIPHLPCNLSDTEPVVAIVARTDSDDQERVVLYDRDAAVGVSQTPLADPARS